MKKVRIIERTYGNGKKCYHVQEKHWLLWWKWVDIDYWGVATSYDTLVEAEKDLWIWKRVPPIDKIVGGDK
jgi:hypothetical protein